MKIYGMIVMLRYHQTNSGALNTMVALKWNGNGEIDILVTILVCWRLGPYADPDQQGDMYILILSAHEFQMPWLLARLFTEERFLYFNSTISYLVTFLTLCPLDPSSF